MRILLSPLVVLLLISPLNAEVIQVTAGEHDLLPQTAGQEINIMVTAKREDEDNEEPVRVQGVNFEVQIGGGGTKEVPTIANVDLLGDGLLFAGLREEHSGHGSWADEDKDGAWTWSLTVPDGGGPDSDGFLPLNQEDSYNDSHILATVEINTGGFDADSSFPLKLWGNEPQDWSTDFASWQDEANHELSVSNGTVNVVPEPASVMLLSVGGLFAGMVGFFARRRRKQ